MFGSKQPATPKKPYSIFVLMQDYMVQGLSADPDLDVFEYLRSAEWKEVFFYDFVLKDGQLFSAGRLNLTPQPFSEWTLTAPASVVAVLPGDDASLALTQKHFQRKYNFPATVYAGPYIIKGQVLDNDQDHSGVVTPVGIFFPVANASVNCAIPGSTIPAMQIPLLAVNLYLTHGISWEQ